MGSPTLTVLLSVLTTLAGIAGGALPGFALGARVRGKGVAYWALNIGAVVVGFGLSVAAAALSSPYLSFASIGFIAGAFTGLKYGYGASVGLWRTHDVWLRSDADLRGPDDRDGASHGGPSARDDVTR